MKQTEQALDRIFAICDDVAKTGETIRTEKEGEEAARAFLGNESSSGAGGAAIRSTEASKPTTQD